MNPKLAKCISAIKAKRVPVNLIVWIKKIQTKRQIAVIKEMETTQTSLVK